MIYGLIPSLSCIVPAVLIIIVYFLQERKSNISTGLFMSFIITILIIILLESLTVIFDTFGFLLLEKIAFRIHFFAELVFVCELTLYNYFNLKGDRDKQFTALFKERKFVKYYLLFLLIVSLSFLFLKLDVVLGEVSYLPGKSCYVILGGIFVSALCQIFFLLVMSKEDRRSRRLTIYSICGFILYILMQVTSVIVAYDAIIFFLITLITYIVKENPDVYIAEEVVIAQQKVNEVNTGLDLTLLNIKNNSMFNIDKIISITSEYADEEMTKEKISVDVDNLFEMISSTSMEINNNLVSLLEKPNIKDIRMNDVIGRFNKYARNKAQSKNLDLRITIGENVASEIKCDDDALYYLLISMFNASYDDTEEGIIEFVFNGILGVDGYHLSITCEDTGKGKTQKGYDTLNEILLTGAHLQKVNANYLMMKRHLDRLNGTYKIEGTKEVGTLIIIDILFERVSNKIEPSLTLGNTVYSIANPHDQTGKKVMFVSDDPGMLVYYKELFDLYNLEIVLAEGTASALDHVKREEIFDYIFVDTFMENYNGFKFGQALKSLATKYDYNVPCSVGIIPYQSLQNIDYIINHDFKKIIMAPVTIDDLNRLFTK